MPSPNCKRPINTFRRLLAAISALAAVAVVGCAPTPELEQTVHDVDISAFSAPLQGPLPEVVATPMPEVEPPAVADIERTVTLADGSKVIRKEEVITGIDPATEKDDSQFIDEGSQRTLRVGQRWLVESLIGQINGRPIFAEEIFKQIEAAVLLASQDPNPESARTQVDALVRRAFRQQVESELILAEAESRLSPEMKVGLLGWLRDLQETTIAQRGGNRASAEEALRDEMQMSVEEFVTFRKNAELTRDILRRKVEPRVVVSWRDVERLYRQRHSAYQPDPIYRLGRIRLAKEQQADKIEVVKRMIAEKKTFTEIADAVGTPEHGMWRAVTVTDGKMMVADMTNDLQRLIAPLQPGQISEPLDARTSMTWFAVISEETPPRLSLFDADLQLSLRAELQGSQERSEQARYIQSLQKRWLGASISKMEIRLVQIARERYLDPLRAMKGAQQGPSR